MESMSIQSVNPATEEPISTYPETHPEEVKRIIEDAHKAFLEWRNVSFAARAKKMVAAAKILRANKEEYGKLMTEEMGKPLAQGIAETEKCAWVCEFYAEKAAQFLAPQPVETDASKSFVSFSPLGIVLAVMPWNFPFWQVFRFAAPALMAGNAGLLKHASNCARIRAGHRIGVSRSRISTGFVPHASDSQ